MARQQNRAMMEMEGVVTKIRKRGCSTSSSSSSKVHSYRFKKGILVGKKARGGIGLGGSRCSTPVPSWKMTPSRTAAIESPIYSQKSNNGGGGRSQPVSARKLAATFWEMSKLSTPKWSENLVEQKKSKQHLLDPAHSPVSERMDQSTTGSYQMRSSSMSSQRFSSKDNNAGVLDSWSIASLMEIETNSRAQTPSQSGVPNRLKDISNALSTSKELLKILNRIWAKADQPSANMSLISALHAELDRARLQVNQLVQEHKLEQQEVNCLLKCFAEEKAAWRNKERQAVEAAIENIEAERKLRHRLERLNKKLGKELSETKTSFTKAVKELEREKKAREIVELVCDELARDIGEDKALLEELKRDAENVREEVEKEREMLHVADMLREERVQMKLLDAKHQYEEKNSAVDKLREQLEAFLTKGGKEKKTGCLNFGNGEVIQGEETEDDGEVEDAVDTREDSAESEMHSIELNMDNNRKGYKWGDHTSSNFVAEQMTRRCSFLQRSGSDGVEWGMQARSIQNRAESLIVEKINELENKSQRNSSADEMQQNKAMEKLRNDVLSRSGSGPWPSQDTCSMAHERSNVVQGSRRKSRVAESIRESQSTTARKSKS